ncbi:MAG: hypothetical protein R2851_02215 [Caldilineaceae bacterium]
MNWPVSSRRWAGMYETGSRVTALPSPSAVAAATVPNARPATNTSATTTFSRASPRGGSFAELVAIRHADVNLVRLPDALSFVGAAILGCRFITAFRAVVQQGRVAAGDWVAVHGCGGVGLSAIMIAQAAGANVLAVDIDDAKLDLARSVKRWPPSSAAHVDDVPGAVRELTRAARTSRWTHWGARPPVAIRFWGCANGVVTCRWD